MDGGKHDRSVFIWLRSGCAQICATFFPQLPRIFFVSCVDVDGCRFLRNCLATKNTGVYYLGDGGGRLPPPRATGTLHQKKRIHSIKAKTSEDLGWNIYVTTAVLIPI